MLVPSLVLLEVELEQLDVAEWGQQWKMLVAVEIEAVEQEEELGIVLEQQLGGKLVESGVGLDLEQLGLEGKLAQLCFEKDAGTAV